jgi:hypothetical protein
MLDKFGILPGTKSDEVKFNHFHAKEHLLCNKWLKFQIGAQSCKFCNQLLQKANHLLI